MTEYITDLKWSAQETQLHTVKTETFPAELGYFCGESEAQMNAG